MKRFRMTVAGQHWSEVVMQRRFIAAYDTFSFPVRSATNA
jgi:hypothetical protein